jgi:hypothetical protein
MTDQLLNEILEELKKQTQLLSDIKTGIEESDSKSFVVSIEGRLEKLESTLDKIEFNTNQ